MLKNRLVVKSCVAFACISLVSASPAWPQTVAPSSASAATPAMPAPPPNMRALLRSLGLSRPSREIQFTKVSADNARAVFSNLTVTDATGQTSTMAGLTVLRDPATGVVGLEFENYVSKDVQISKAVVSGVRGDFAVNRSVATIARSQATAGNAHTLSPTSPTNFSVASMALTNLKFRDAANIAGPMDITFGEVFARDLASQGSRLSFGEFGASKMVFTVSGADVKVETMRMTDVVQIMPDAPVAGTTAQPAKVDFSKISWGGFSMNGWTMSLRDVASANKGSGQFTLGSLSFGELKDGMLKSFGLSGIQGSVNAGGGAAAQTVNMGLGSFTLSDMNLKYYTAIGEMFGLAINPVDGAASNLKLKDVLTGGPLDSGLGGMTLDDMSFDIFGVSMVLDNFLYRQDRNAQGIVTKAELPSGDITVSWGEVDSPFGEQIKSFTSLISSNEMKLGFTAAASYVPGSDRISLNDYTLDLKGWGKSKMAFVLTGVDQFLSQTSLTDLIAVAKQSTTGAAMRGNPRDAMKKTLELYGPVALQSGSWELVDTGGTDNVAALAMRMRNLTGTQTVSRPSNDELRAQRMRWATGFRADAGKKSTDPFLRQMMVGLARLLEGGGTLKIEANPTTPVRFSTLASDTNPSPQAWGLRVTNQGQTPAPAPAPARR